ncbi:interleukin 1 receptor associated kinase 4 tube [Musca autumnalis]|uniref:interleukin 1 receptor associated kinase 4 tube n=1 Tax=Musca autumnalis TaxID=221902 RepID=UPI003CE722C6
MSAAYTRDTELRNVQSNDLYKLASILVEEDYWQKLMETIPKKIDNKLFGSSTNFYNDAYSSAPLSSSERKYTNDHIRLIQNEYKRSGNKLCAELLFDEWSTSGRKNERPTLGVLLYLLLKAHLFRGADYVAVDLLKEQTPPRPPDGPAAGIPIELPDAIFTNISIVEDSQNYPNTELLQQNANFECSSMDNNKDYYTKYRKPIDKYFAPSISSSNDNVEAPQPPPRSKSARQMKQKLTQHTQSRISDIAEQTATITNQHDMIAINEHPQETSNGDVSLATTNNLPNFSLLMESSDSIKSDSIPKISFLIGNSQSSYESKSSNNDRNIVHQNKTETGIPSNDIEPSSHDLPAISALNLNGERDNAFRSINSSDKDVPSVALHFDANSSTSIDITSSNIPYVVEDIAQEINIKHSELDNETDNSEDDDDEDDIDDDDDDADVPNFSLLNDSSLTSVTTTSAENSFEQNNDSRPTSTDNIPPLNTECIPTLN